MTIADKATRRVWFSALRDRELEWADPEDRKLYQPLHDEAHDPVRRLRDVIDLSSNESFQVVLGFRGTGKTTEFSRLSAELSELGYHVVRVDFRDYLDLKTPVEISDLLPVIAGAVHERMAAAKLIAPPKKAASFLQRMIDLGKRLRIDEAKLSPPYGELTIKVSGEPTFREQVRQALRPHLPSLIAAYKAHHSDLIAALRKHQGDEAAQLVVILDSLEHLRGGENASEVRQSLQELFLSHGDQLAIPGAHVIMTIPAFLELHKLNLEARLTGAVQSWACCKVRDRAGAPVSEVIDRLIQLVRRRCDWEQLLGDREEMEELVLRSGGYIRELLNMMVEAVLQASRGSVLRGQAERIARAVQRKYGPLFEDDVRVLREVEGAKGFTTLARTDEDLVAGMLDGIQVLPYLNDDFWFALNPLVQAVLDSEPASRG